MDGGQWLKDWPDQVANHTRLQQCRAFYIHANACSIEFLYSFLRAHQTYIERKPSTSPLQWPNGLVEALSTALPPRFDERNEHHIFKADASAYKQVQANWERDMQEGIRTHRLFDPADALARSLNMTDKMMQIADSMAPGGRA